MSRIDGIDPEHASGPIARVLEAQRGTWGAPLANHLVYDHELRILLTRNVDIDTRCPNT